jgi:hypothetical protein
MQHDITKRLSPVPCVTSYPNPISDFHQSTHPHHTFQILIRKHHSPPTTIQYQPLPTHSTQQSMPQLFFTSLPHATRRLVQQGLLQSRSPTPCNFQITTTPPIESILLSFRICMHPARCTMHMYIIPAPPSLFSTRGAACKHNKRERCRVST